MFHSAAMALFAASGTAKPTMLSVVVSPADPPPPQADRAKVATSANAVAALVRFICLPIPY